MAELELALSAEAGASAARMRVYLDVPRQTFDPRFTVRTLLHGTALAKFDGEKRHIAIELDRTQLTDSAEVQAQFVLPDAAEVPPVVTRALADLDLGRLLQWIPAEWRPFSIERGKVHLDAQEVTLSAMPQLGAHGRLGLDPAPPSHLMGAGWCTSRSNAPCSRWGPDSPRAPRPIWRHFGWIAPALHRYRWRSIFRDRPDSRCSHAMGAPCTWCSSSPTPMRTE
jgi:hypothetical protein